MKLYYYSRERNFGDAVNPYILENIFGKKCVSASPSDADLFMIGSILGKALVKRKKIFTRIQMAFKNPLTIWSSGFINDHIFGKCMARNLNVCALRGVLSLRLLEKVSGEKFNPVLGDGGLLISNLFREYPAKKYEVGIIPHYVDENLPEIAFLQKKIPGSVVISPLGDPLECAKKIAECNTIISSSLHGLIAADSFGIPNCQMVISSNIAGGQFKYDDYYSVFNGKIQPLTCKDILINGINADEIRSRYKISADRISEIKGQLINSFPMHME